MSLNFNNIDIKRQHYFSMQGFFYGIIYVKGYCKYV